MGEVWLSASFAVPCWQIHRSGKARLFCQFVGAAAYPCALDNTGRLLLLQELQPGPHGAGDVAGAIAPGITYGAAGIAGLL